MKYLWTTLLILSALGLAVSAVAKKDHRHHDSHVHGSGKLALAFDDKAGKLEFKVPAESLLGFEHEPKTDKDKKAVENLKTHFESEIANMVALDPQLNCKFKKDKVELVRKGKHADFIADFQVQCEKPVLGSSMIFDFAKFKNLKKLEAIVLAGSVQKTVKVEQKPITLELKP